MGFSIKPNPGVEFDVVHADSELLIINKPAGVATQPGKGHERDSLLNGLFCDYGNALQNLGEERTWGLLHRLDKDTSGLLIVALRIKAYEHLSDQFKDRQVKKVYYTLVQGTPRPPQGVIQQPIAEVIGARKKAVIRRDGKPAVTAYKVIAGNPKVSLVEARPTTGRLHQVRVHLASLGCPIVGESVYASAESAALPLCLHAAEVSFIHPVSGHRVSFAAAIPRAFASVAKKLGVDVRQSVHDEGR